MIKKLGRKQSIDNACWIDAMEHIEEYVSRPELDELTGKTVDEIKRITADKKAAYAWSAGKDSIVLGKICELAGIKDCMIGLSKLEYPAFTRWVCKNQPENLQILRVGPDIEWLKKHPEMLFPKDAKTAATWFKIVQHRAQEIYYREKGLDMILLGRRRADGNYVGRKGNIYTNGKGITRYSPLSEWTHEAVLAFIHYHNLDIPPIYSWEKGYTCGTHPWPARQHMKTDEQGWSEIYAIDKNIVIGAAEHIASAKEFLEKLK